MNKEKFKIKMTEVLQIGHLLTQNGLKQQSLQHGRHPKHEQANWCEKQYSDWLAR